MSWTLYWPKAVTVSALLMGVWLLGRQNCSIVWLLVLIGTYVAYLAQQGPRDMKRYILRRLINRDDEEIVKTQMQELPAWVQFPDAERVEWINKLVAQLWPYIGQFSKQIIKQTVEPIIRANMPSAFSSFEFELIDMGDIPPRLGGIKTYRDAVGREQAVLDIEVAYAGDLHFIVSVGAFKAGIKDVVFRGTLRVVLRPLIPVPPLTGGVAVSFLDDPMIDFDLSGIGEFVELPGLRSVLDAIVRSQVRNLLLLPNEIVVPLAQNLDDLRLQFPEPEGVLHIHVLEGKDLEDKDSGIIRGKSDPYVKLSVGSQFFKTETVSNSLNPKWNDNFEAVIDQATGQSLTLEVFDEDTAAKDEEMGNALVNIEQARFEESVDMWVELEGAKSGSVHLELRWMNLMYDLSPDANVREGNFHPALLLVFLDSIQNLPRRSRNKEPSPYVQLTLGKESHQSALKLKTTNPVFQQRFLYFVSEPTREELHVEAFDKDSGKSLGEMRIPVKFVMESESMEVYQNRYQLVFGSHESDIVLTLRLRGLQANAPPLGTYDALGDVKEKKPEIHTLVPQS